MSAVLQHEQAQFDSVEAALWFAFRPNRENFQLSLINRMAGGPTPPGRGLGGLDGAAVAGSIRRHVEALGVGPATILRASFSNREVKCDCGRGCCKGYKTSEEWLETIGDVVRAIRGCISGLSNYRYVYGACCKYLGAKNIRLGELAESCQIPELVSQDHNSKIKQFIHKTKATAMHQISISLREAGIVGVSE